MKPTDSRYVYLIHSDTGYKVGVSINPTIRLKQLQTASTSKLKLVSIFKSKYPFVVETTLKNRFSNNSILGEWYNLPDSDVANFLQICEKIENNLDVIYSTSTLYS